MMYGMFSRGSNGFRGDLDGCILYLLKTRYVSKP